jgi:hypothetical protein
MKGMFLGALAVLVTSACASTPTASAPPPPQTVTLRGQFERCTPGEDVYVMIDGKMKKARCEASKQVQVGVCDPADPKAGTKAKCTRF